MLLPNCFPFKCCIIQVIWCMMSQDQGHIEKLVNLCRICGETGGETESN